ncbi:MAG TPA: VOC family protein [Thermoplasmata archaeon]|nr:VOC family protein [Thermoplasmata archaeon]
MVGIVSGMGHIVVPVHKMAPAVKFYRDVLGFKVVGKVDPVWTVVNAKGVELTLFRTTDPARIALGKEGEDSPFYLHVANFPRAAAALEKKRFRVKRFDDRQGIVWDPSGNVLGLHDHRKRAGSRPTS